MMIRKLSKKRACIGLLGIVILVWPLGCTTVEKIPPKLPPNENVLRVGIFTNAPPLIFKQNQEIVGLEADFAKEFAKYLGKSLHFVELKWEDQIPALLENRIDIIMSGMTITALRQVRVAFSTAYFRSGQMALIRTDDVTRFRTGFYAIGKEMVIGAVKNTTSDFFVQKLFSYNKKVTYSSSTEGVKALIDGAIDMLIHDAPIILYLASENETRGVTPLFSLLTEEYFGWAIRKDDIELLKAANNFLQALNNDGRLKNLINRWIPFTN